jgi:threonine dehydrogenase-like Zn-dependent dehydrogenase
MEITELWHNNTESWFRHEKLNQPKDHVLIRSMYSMVSQGTERLLMTKNIKESTEKIMRVPYMKGSFNDNFTYGYSLVGEIVDKPGRLVHLMHPHQDFATARPEDLLVLPEDLDPKVATLISNMETAVNAIWDAQVELGDKVLVMGLGTIGSLISLVLNESIGVSFDILELNENRVQKGNDLNLPVTTQVNHHEYDIVINATGNAQALQEAFKYVRKEGRILELSWHGERQVKLDLGDDFHYGRIQLLSSQVGSIPHRKNAIWDFKKRKQLVVTLLQKINPSSLIDLAIDFFDAPEFYESLRNSTPSNIGIILKY